MTDPKTAASAADMTLASSIRELAQFAPDQVQHINALASRIEAMQQDQKRISHEHHLLASAIGEAALKCGLVRSDIEGLTGPQLLMLCDNMAEVIMANESDPLAIGSDEVLIALKRVEGYEDVHPELLVDDARFNWPQFRIVPAPSSQNPTQAG